MDLQALEAMPLEDGDELEIVGPVAEIRRARAEGIRPEAQVTVSEWSDLHRRLPSKSSAEPGPWRTDRTPYLREIMDCLSSTSEVEEVVVMAAAQVGKTETILNALGYVIDHAPGPVILVQPTVELAKRFSRQRVDPLVTDTPRLASKVAAAKARDSGNTMLSKEFPGGQLIITGANSAVGLRSMPAQYAFMDEIDGYPVDVDEEGSPLALVEARQRTFARKKRAKVSTPTIAGRSAVEEAYHDTDQRRFYVPCPDCGEMQPLEFSQLQWTKYGREPEDAVYECRACYFLIEQHRKTELLERGAWVAEKPGHGGRKVRGYHLSAMYAPAGWISWGDIAAMFVKVHKIPEKFRVFVNTVLGQTWREVGDAPEWEAIMRRRSAYAIGTVPAGVVLLTAGVDVQKDRLVYEVVGWGRGKRSWSVDAGELPGDTADLVNGPWRQLAEFLERQYPHASGLTLPITMMAVDSGFNTQTVYNWCRKYPMNRVMAVKGIDAGVVLVGSPVPVDVMINGKKTRRGTRYWPVCGGIAKSELFGWLRLDRGDGQAPDGYCDFPEYGDEFFKQLTAEQLVSHRTRRGYIKMEWEVIPGRQNHALDARVYARAAAQVSGLDRFRDSDWTKREAAFPVVAPATVGDVAVALLGALSQSSSPVAPVVKNTPPTKNRKSAWIQRRPDWLKGKR